MAVEHQAEFGLHRGGFSRTVCHCVSAKWSPTVPSNVSSQSFVRGSFRVIICAL